MVLSPSGCPVLPSFSFRTPFGLSYSCPSPRACFLPLKLLPSGARKNSRSRPTEQNIAVSVRARQIFKLTIGTLDDPQLPTIRNRLIAINPVVFVWSQLFSFIVGFADESVNDILGEPICFQVGHSSLGGSVVEGLKLRFHFLQFSNAISVYAILAT